VVTLTRTLLNHCRACSSRPSSNSITSDDFLSPAYFALMSGRGRGRPPSRSAQEGASRRSTRHQQQQNAPQPGEAPPHPDLPEQQQQHGHQQQLDAPMSASAYHQNIDPAITGSQDGGMPPPPVPSAKGLRGQAGLSFPRRGANPASPMASSVNSIQGTDTYSSQPEPQSKCMQSFDMMSHANPPKAPRRRGVFPTRRLQLLDARHPLHLLRLTRPARARRGQIS
jgi:hypothetical protein